jgi:uncharacterized OB-fold protein
MGKIKETDDRFLRFGFVGFTAMTKTNDFIDFLEKGEVRGTRCKDCGKVFFPPRSDCCQCLSDHMEWVEVSGPGKLVTYSRLQYAPAGFEAELPYTIALAEFENCKVFGRLSPEIAEDAVAPGMALTIEVLHLSDERLTYVFKET